jgi:hypothetical protein
MCRLPYLYVSNCHLCYRMFLIIVVDVVKLLIYIMPSNYKFSFRFFSEVWWKVSFTVLSNLFPCSSVLWEFKFYVGVYIAWCRWLTVCWRTSMLVKFLEEIDDLYEQWCGETLHVIELSRWFSLPSTGPSQRKLTATTTTCQSDNESSVNSDNQNINDTDKIELLGSNYWWCQPQTNFSVMNYAHQSALQLQWLLVTLHFYLFFTILLNIVTETNSRYAQLFFQGYANHAYDSRVWRWKIETLGKMVIHFVC